jgi:hypothetical protein
MIGGASEMLLGDDEGHEGGDRNEAAHQDP